MENGMREGVMSTLIWTSLHPEDGPRALPLSDTLSPFLFGGRVLLSHKVT